MEEGEGFWEEGSVELEWEEESWVGVWRERVHWVVFGVWVVMLVLVLGRRGDSHSE